MNLNDDWTITRTDVYLKQDPKKTLKHHSQIKKKDLSDKHDRVRADRENGWGKLSFLILI